MQNPAECMEEINDLHGTFELIATQCFTAQCFIMHLFSNNEGMT